MTSFYNSWNLTRLLQNFEA